MRTIPQLQSIGKLIGLTTRTGYASFGDMLNHKSETYFLPLVGLKDNRNNS